MISKTILTGVRSLRDRVFSARPSTFQSHIEGVLGTLLELQTVASSPASGKAAEDSVLAEIDRLEIIFNAYSPTSELSRWQSTWDQDVRVSRELAYVLGEAEEWRQRSNGVFNPAVEAMTRQWKSFAAMNKAADPSVLSASVVALQQPLWQVDRQEGTARRLTGLPCTLNSIAKGFIIDRATAVLREQPSLSAGLINIGGDLCHFGDNAIPVAIADPFQTAENAPPIAIVRLQNEGMATSGNYRRGFQVGERWYSHVIDPRTGWPVEHVVSASVIAADTMTADILATIFSVLTPEESLSFADTLSGVALLLVTAEGNQIANARWKARVQTKEQ